MNRNKLSWAAAIAPIALLFTPAFLLADVPHVFHAGAPIKSSDVNDNFAAVGSAFITTVSSVALTAAPKQVAALSLPAGTFYVAASALVVGSGNEVGMSCSLGNASSGDGEGGNFTYQLFTVVTLAQPAQVPIVCSLESSAPSSIGTLTLLALPLPNLVVQ